MLSPKHSKMFNRISATFEMMEFVTRILFLLLLTDNVIGQASSDGTLPANKPSIPIPEISSSPSSFTPSAYSQLTNSIIGGSSFYSTSSLFSDRLSIVNSQADRMQADTPTVQLNHPNKFVTQPPPPSPPQPPSALSQHTSLLSSSVYPSPYSTEESAVSNINDFLVQRQQEQQLEMQRRNYPYIDKTSSPNVTALLGKTAYLTCRVKNLGDKTVSWVRHRDIHLITVGRYTYTTDQRFRAILQPNTDEYTLMIKYPQHRDSGIYECQVSTTPHLSHYIHLSIVEPVTEVVGGPDLFIDRGSTINLTCTVKFSPEPPTYIIWNHNNNIISYNSPRGGVSVLTEKGDTTTSYLLIQQAKPTDSGRYSCNPSNAVPHSINVHVLNGELPDALQTGGQMPQKIPIKFCLLFTVVLIFGTA